MKKFWIGALTGFGLSLAVMAWSDEAFYSGKIAFVNVAEENLRNTPGGDKIGVLVKGAPMQVLKVEDKWLRVAAVGFIWRESVTGDERNLRASAFRVAMILVQTEAEANAVLQELRGGSDFATVAKEKSIGPNHKNGGDLGEAFPGDFEPEIESAILALKVGEISGVVSTKHGFQIFKRLK